MINIRQWRFVLIAKTTQRRFGKWRNMPENCLVRNRHFSVPKVRTSGQVQNIHWSQFVCCTRTTHIKYYCSRFRPLVQSTQGQSPRAIPVVHCTMYCKAYTLYICGTMIMGCHFGGGGREGSTCTVCTYYAFFPRNHILTKLLNHCGAGLYICLGFLITCNVIVLQNII